MSEIGCVRRWLERSGYPFEFVVAAAFRGAGFAVYQGMHYRPESADATGARDIDVLAVREEFVHQHPMTRCTVVYVTHPTHDCLNERMSRGERPGHQCWFCRYASNLVCISSADKPEVTRSR